MAFQLSYGLLNFGYLRVRSKSKQNADQYVLRFIFKQRKHVQAYFSIHLILIKLNQCWWRLLETVGVDDKIEMLVTEFRCQKIKKSHINNDSDDTNLKL